MFNTNQISFFAQDVKECPVADYKVWNVITKKWHTKSTIDHERAISDHGEKHN